MLLIHTTGWTDILEQHRDWSPAAFALNYSGKKEWPVREIAEQLHCYPRAERKLLDLHTPGMIYLREPLEQSSGFAAATYRARRWSASSAADLTGGLGVDTAAWARSGASVYYCEKNTELAEIAGHNHRLLGLEGKIFHTNDDGMSWLASRSGEKPGEPFCDIVYIDPSRRSRGRRVVTPDDSEPPVLQHLDLIRSAGSRYLVKLSPMMDANLAGREFEGCRTIVAVSVEGEVKELLVEGIGHHGVRKGKHQGLHQDQSEQPDDQHELSRPVPEVVLLDSRGYEKFRVTGPADKADRAAADIMPPDEWLYDPDPALHKMKLIDQVAVPFGLGRLHRDAGYLTGSHLASDFPGKVYKIEEILEFKPRKVKTRLKQQGYERVHIHQRGFPHTVDQLYRKLNLKMGDDAHLFALSDHQDRLVLLVTRPEKI